MARVPRPVGPGRESPEPHEDSQSGPVAQPRERSDESPGDRVWRVWAVVPCFNRPRDLQLLVQDLTGLDLGTPPRVHLSVLIVDNASTPPLRDLPLPADPRLRIEHLRLQTNTGGSGGFNAGLAEALLNPIQGALADAVWMVDSDARVEPETLLRLLEALEADPSLAAVGSALVDPATGDIHEIGGRVNRWTGAFEPAAGEGTGIRARRGIAPADPGRPFRVDYIAACSALIRRQAIEQTGLMPDVFLNADDVEWFVRMGRIAGGIAAVPASRATHPTFDRFQTWARYYIARNGFGPIDALGLGGGVRFVRAMRETLRAALQAMMGRRDLAELHLRGLRDAAAGRRIGPAAKGVIEFEPFRPLAELRQAVEEMWASKGASPARVYVHPGLRDSAAIREALCAAHVEAFEQASGDRSGRRSGALAAIAGATWRLLAGPTAEVAFVPARGRPECWARGRAMVLVVPEGFVIRRLGRFSTVWRTVRVMLRGGWLSARLALGAGRHGAAPLPRARRSPARAVPGEAAGLTLSIIILSYNRWSALRATLERLLGRSGEGGPPPRAAAQGPASSPHIIVVDNASTDGTPARLGEVFPEVEVIALDANRGAGAFNIGAARCTSDLLLILDDDAYPDPEALEAAMAHLAQRPGTAAVALHPRHPASGQSEWGFARRLRGPQDDWPVMGCGNLVRRKDWERVGGYDDAFFLYRNDVDLAMKLLAAGRNVHFDPAWTVWHDSPAGAGGRKSLRWFELAMRNWVWLCRRHGRGPSKVAALASGWLWAHRLAGFSPRAHLRVLCGVARGWFERPPVLPEICRRDGRAVRRLLQLRRIRR